ncbi:MAG TPA: DUF2946 family protein [Povalibacter sp.]
MLRCIVGFRQDEEHHWVVELDCGHSQHVRHNPPWSVREWVTTPEGRQQAMGSSLECGWCDQSPPIQGSASGLEDWVVRAMRRWPNVPALFGWLGLDRRGRWLIRGELITRPQIIDTINANYASDSYGRWFFQNGPQRGYVALEIAPFVLHVADEHLMTHTNRSVERPGPVFLDEAGSLFFVTEHGPGILIDSDLDWAVTRLQAAGTAMDEAALTDALSRASGQMTDLTLKIGGQCLSVARLDRHLVAEQLGFSPHPEPRPGESVSVHASD